MNSPVTPRSNDRPMAAAIVAGFGFLILAIAASIAASLASAEADRAASHSLLVRQALGHMFSSVQDAETGQRGFLLTGDASYLPPFTSAKDEMPAAESTLRSLTMGNPREQEQLDKIYATIASKLAS